MKTTWEYEGEEVTGYAQSSRFLGDQRWLLCESEGQDWLVPWGSPNNATAVPEFERSGEGPGEYFYALRAEIFGF